MLPWVGCELGAVRVTSLLSSALRGNRPADSRMKGVHDVGTGQGQRDARGVDGDPAAAPLLGDSGGGAGAAGGIENKIAGSVATRCSAGLQRTRLDNI